MKINIIELFGGIGAATEALKRLNFNVEVVDYVEIDKFAVASYNAINSEHFEPQDITKWDKELKADLIMHGSPCQDFSAAGLNMGGDESLSTRSSLLYQSLRIIAKVKPKYVIWENVKNVLCKKHKPNFDKYIQKMSDLGYSNYYQVLNAKNYEIPQNRERVFVVSILGNRAFNFPKKKPLKFTYKDFLQDNPNAKFYYNQNSKIFNTLNKYIKNGNLYEYSTRRTPPVREFKNRLTHTLTASMGMAGNKIPIFKVDEKYHLTEQQHKNRQNSTYMITKKELIKKDIISTQTARQYKGGQYFKNDNLYRKLTPLECWRLMGFSDESFFKAAAVNSDTQLYKQAGNSIVVNVLMAIFEQLFLKKNFKETLF